MTIERLNAKPTRWTTLLGLVLVPVLFAGGLLAANWNNDERLRTVEAAIVNLDEPATVAGEYVPLGRQLTAALVDSDRVENLRWELASEEGAREGLASGQYAAMVTIPPEFSTAATSYAGEAADANSATVQIATSPVAGIADATLAKVVAQEAAGVLNETLTSAYLDQLYIGFNEMGEQFVTIADGAAELADGARQLADGIGEAADGAVQLADGTSELANGLDTMAEETSSLPAQTRTLAKGVGTYVGGVNDLVDQTIASVGMQGDLVDGVGQLSRGASGIATGLEQYQSQIGQLASNPDVVTPTVAGAQQAAATQVAQYVPCPTFDPDPTIQAATCAVFTAGRDAGAQVGAQVGAVAGLTAGGQAAAAGLSQADPRTGESLLSGAQQVAGGLNTLSDQLQASADAAGDPAKAIAQLRKLKAGGNQLAKGTDQLADGIPALADGIAQVADGASQLADGTDELAEGLADAADGGTQLADGAQELADGLAEGKDQLPSYSASDRENLSEVVAAPVSTANLLGTAGFGAGWVTLLMVLALWAGAMATFFVFKPVSTQLLGSARPSARLVATTLAPSALVVSAQAVLVTVIGQFALELSAGKLLAVAGLMLLTGLTFVVINHALAAWFGNAGRLVALGLAILSLASALTSAAPAVFGALRGFSPLTPGLDAVRAVVTESGAATTSTFLLVGWLVVGFAASVIAIVRHRTTSFEALLAAHGVQA